MWKIPSIIFWMVIADTSLEDTKVLKFGFCFPKNVHFEQLCEILHSSFVFHYIFNWLVWSSYTPLTSSNNKWSIPRLEITTTSEFFHRFSDIFVHLENFYWKYIRNEGGENRRQSYANEYIQKKQFRFLYDSTN